METCKDCVYFIKCGNYEGLRKKVKVTGWVPSWVLCSYKDKTGTVENDWTETCPNFRRKKMSNRIEIEVKINGKTAKLSDVSDETIANIKKAEQVIKHGDYGYRTDNDAFRLFVKVAGRVKGYGKNTGLMQDNANACVCKYTITGNIFKELENIKNKS